MPNRNTESSFSRLPGVRIHRSKFPYKCENKFTGNVGDLIPFMVDEVLPGDTFNIKLSKLVRLSTSIHPTMDNLYLDTYFFFVPNRLIWENWQKFMGENDQAWAQNTDLFIPPSKKFSTSDKNDPGSIFNYLGIPAFAAGKKQFDVTLLDLNAYIKIWNDWFRDENLMDECPFYKGDGTIPGSYWSAFTSFMNNTFGVNGLGYNTANSCLKVSKFHDYFTSCLPAPQKGADVLIPAGGNVLLDASGYDSSDISGTAPKFVAASDGTTALTGSITGSTNSSYPGALTVGGNIGVYDPNGTLKLDGLQITVNNLRLAMQTQRLLERDARSGTRYTEILRGHFGVTSPDARLQRSEYLGGKRTLLNMSEVVQTSESTSTNKLGSLAGRSSTADVEDGFIKSFVEHGYIIGVCCVRPDRTYSQGVPRRYFRTNRLEYYFPVLANIGEQPVYNKEIFLPGTSESVSGDEVFGYQEPWAEYRYKLNRTAGFFQPGISGTLDSWHYADNYSTTPNLSSAWLKQGTTEVDRTLAVGSAATHQLLFDFYCYGSMVRPMPVHSIPGLVDHN